MKNLKIVIFSTMLTTLLYGQDQKINDFENQIIKEEGKILINIKLNPKTSIVELSSSKLGLINNKDINLSDKNYKNEYEKLRFKREIAAIPKSSQFIIHLDADEKIYKITNMGNIFALDVSHTMAHENNSVHSHSFSTSFNLNALDSRQNNSIIFATKGEESFRVLDVVSFNQNPWYLKHNSLIRD